MPRLEWGTPGTHVYEAGVDRGVLYIDGQPGVAWSGLTSVEENPSGGGSKSYYLDGEKYLNVSAREEFGATINAFTYPDLFAQCDGTIQARPGLFLPQQRRKSFGFSYRTLIGSDLNGDLGYKIHLIYNALAEPSDKTYSSTGDSIDPLEFSWNITTRAPVIPGYKRTAHVEIDSRTTTTVVLDAVENVLYGDAEHSPRLPSFAELTTLYDAFYNFEVIDNGDGTFTVNGPDDAIQFLDTNIVYMDWPTVVNVDATTSTISSG